MIKQITSGKLKCGFLETEFDFIRIKKDVLNFIKFYKPSSVNQKGHATNWTNPYGEVEQLNLLHPKGQYSDFTDNSGMFDLGSTYPGLTKFVKRWDNLISFRINILKKHSGLSQHKETIVVNLPGGGTGIKVRFHLPIQTRRDCSVFVGGDIHHLREGNIYYFNNGCVHSAENTGIITRIHLVWDMYLSELLYVYLKDNLKELEPVGVALIDPNAPVDGHWEFDESKIRLI